MNGFGMLSEEMLRASLLVPKRRAAEAEAAAAPQRAEAPGAKRRPMQPEAETLALSRIGDLCQEVGRAPALPAVTVYVVQPAARPV